MLGVPKLLLDFMHKAFLIEKVLYMNFLVKNV